MGLDTQTRQVRVPVQSVARFPARHRLGASLAFGAARAEVKDSLSPVADALFDKVVDRVDFHPLGAPAEDAVGRRVAASDDVDPKRILRWWAGAD